MTRIRWTTEAADQLEGIVQHILKENPEAAREVARAILGRVEDLKHFPRLGRPGAEVKETRELHSPPSSLSTDSKMMLPKSSTYGTARKTGANKNPSGR